MSSIFGSQIRKNSAGPKFCSFSYGFNHVLRTTPLGYCFKTLIRDRDLFQQSLGQLRIELMSTAISHNVTNHFAASESQVANYIQ